MTAFHARYDSPEIPGNTTSATEVSTRHAHRCTRFHTILTGFMKRLLSYPCYSPLRRSVTRLRTSPSAVIATIHQVLLSDEDCKVVGLNVSDDNPNIISIGANELTAFSKAEFDCKKKTIHLVVPATKSQPYFELKSTSKNGHLILGEKKAKVSPDWQM